MRQKLAFVGLLLKVLFVSPGLLALGVQPRELWRDAYSYELCRAAAFSPTRAAVLMPSGVCVLDYSSGEVRRLSTSNHLTTARPVSIALDPWTESLFVGHADGAIDLIEGGYATSVATLRDVLKSDAEVSIRALAVGNSHLYVLQGERVVEVRRGGGFPVEDQLHLWLGNSPESPTCLLADDKALFVGTRRGIVTLPQPIAGSRVYSRLGDLSLPVDALVKVEKGLLALCENAGAKEVYAWHGAAWAKVHVRSGASPISISRGSDGRAYCVTDGLLLRFRSGQFTEVVCELPHIAVSGGADVQGAPVVAFQAQGVQRKQGGAWRRLYGETPRFISVNDVAAMENAVVLTSGHPHDKRSRPFQLYYWNDGQGRNLEIGGAENAGEVIVLNAQEKRYLVCSSGSGLYEFRGERFEAHYDTTNSGLAARGGKTNVWSGIALADGSWWVYNEGSANPLVVRDARGVWHALPWPDNRPDLPPSFATDRSGAVWIGHVASNRLLRIDPAEFVASRGARGYERKGTDRSATIRCVRVADDDKLWVGLLDDGTVYALSASSLAGREASFSMFDWLDPTLPGGYTNYLLSNPPIEKLLADYGSNIWIATARGGLAHLMVQQQSVRRLYNVDNSPIPSRFLHSLALTSDGTLWIASDRGAMRLLSDSQEPRVDFSNVRVYPNPVRPDYDGWITIDGLQEGTTVKVIDMGGTLARELFSNGGKAIWDGRNGRGELVESGVYLLFLSTRDGKVTAVEKLVLVR